MAALKVFCVVQDSFLLLQKNRFISACSVVSGMSLANGNHEFRFLVLFSFASSAELPRTELNPNAKPFKLKQKAQQGQETEKVDEKLKGVLSDLSESRRVQVETKEDDALQLRKRRVKNLLPLAVSLVCTSLKRLSVNHVLWECDVWYITLKKNFLKVFD